MSENNTYDATPSDEVTHGTDVALLERRLKGLNGKATNVISSLPDASFEDKVKQMDFLTNSTPLAEIGDGGTIALTNVIVQTIEMEGNAVPRVVLIDENEQSYHAISTPILGSIETLFGIAGHPSTWERPVNATLVKVKAAQGTAFTLRFS